MGWEDTENVTESQSLWRDKVGETRDGQKNSRGLKPSAMKRGDVFSQKWNINPLKAVLMPAPFSLEEVLDAAPKLNSKLRNSSPVPK